MTAAFDTSIKAIEEHVSSIFGQSSVPGAAVAILQRGERWSKGFGVTHVEQPRPVTPETIFQIASATKVTVRSSAPGERLEYGRA